MIDTQSIRRRWDADGSKRDERGKRVFAASEARAAGWGGVAAVAEITGLGREVAIKVLPQHLAASPEVRQRFEREAKTISQLSHPHICALYDVGSHEGTPFVVADYPTAELVKTAANAFLAHPNPTYAEGHNSRGNIAEVRYRKKRANKPRNAGNSPCAEHAPQNAVLHGGLCGLNHLGWPFALMLYFGQVAELQAASLKWGGE